MIMLNFAQILNSFILLSPDLERLLLFMIKILLVENLLKECGKILESFKLSLKI